MENTHEYYDLDYIEFEGSGGADGAMHNLLYFAVWGAAAIYYAFGEVKNKIERTTALFFPICFVSKSGIAISATPKRAEPARAT